MKLYLPEGMRKGTRVGIMGGCKERLSRRTIWVTFGLLFFDLGVRSETA